MKTIGKKAEYLERLRGFSEELGFKVPRFCVIPASVFRAFEQGVDISTMPEVMDAYNESLTYDDVILRSSAEKSEDSDSMMGAGVYESVRLHEIESFENFIDKLVNVVYASVGSPKAREYRSANGVSDEAMSVIVQEYIPCQTNGHANTVHPYCPELSSYLVGQMHVYVKRDDGFIHFPVDATRAENIVDDDVFGYFKRVQPVIMELEKKFGCPLQIEFGMDQFRQPAGALWIFQARPIPEKMLASAKTVSFPDEVPLFEADAIGVFDGLLPVRIIHPEDFYKGAYEEENGFPSKGTLSIFIDGMAASTCPYVQHLMPENGVAIVLGRYSDFHGHLETMAAERGIACLSDDMTSYEARDIAETLAAYGKVRVVSNGIVGKIYPPNDTVGQ